MTAATDHAGSPGAPSKTWKDAQSARLVRRLHWLILVIGFFVHLPSLRCRYLLDDGIHASMVHGNYPVPRGPFDLYDFVGDADRDVLFERGMLPWWSDPHLTIRFFRPLSSALLWSEHKLLGDDPIPLHAVSFLWWIAAVAGARALFTRVLSPRGALIATAILAFSPCHTVPLAWLANREALMSMTLGIFGLDALLRFHGDGRARSGALALSLFTLALLSGEYAVGIGGYALAFALTSRSTDLRRRVLGTLSFAVPLLAYVGVRAKLGYECVGSGPYTDPFVEPRAFLEDAPRRFVTLLSDVWCALDGDAVSMAWLVPLTLVGFAIFVRSYLRAAAGTEAQRRGHISGFLVGSVLALIPVLAVLPSPRVLGVALIGVAAVTGALLDHSWFKVQEKYDQLGGLLALGLAFAHLVHAPVVSWLAGSGFEVLTTELETGSRNLSARLGNTNKSEIFIMRAANGAFLLFFSVDPQFRPPARWRILSQTTHVLALRRGPRVLDLAATESLFEPDSPFRSARSLLKKGDVVTIPGLRATVLESGPLGPRIVRFETDRDLDDYTWIAEERTGFNEARPPAPGFGKPFDR